MNYLRMYKFIQRNANLFSQEWLNAKCNIITLQIKLKIPYRVNMSPCKLTIYPHLAIIERKEKSVATAILCATPIVALEVTIS
jgi:hypothetical protein